MLPSPVGPTGLLSPNDSYQQESGLPTVHSSKSYGVMLTRALPSHHNGSFVLLDIAAKNHHCVNYKTASTSTNGTNETLRGSLFPHPSVLECGCGTAVLQHNTLVSGGSLQDDCLRTHTVRFGACTGNVVARASTGQQPAPGQVAVKTSMTMSALDQKHYQSQKDTIANVMLQTCCGMSRKASVMELHP